MTQTQINDIARLEKIRRFVAIDAESTGVGRPSRKEMLNAAPDWKPKGVVIEIGAVEYLKVDGAWRRGETFHSYVNPCAPISHWGFKIHGITYKTLKGAPWFDRVAPRLMAFLGNAPLVAQGYSNERDYIDFEMARAGLIAYGEQTFPQNRWLCTQSIYRRYFAKSPTNLDAICDALGIDRTGRVKHGALQDAELTAEALLAMAESLKRRSAHAA